MIRASVPISLQPSDGPEQNGSGDRAKKKGNMASVSCLDGTPVSQLYIVNKAISVCGLDSFRMAALVGGTDADGQLARAVNEK